MREYTVYMHISPSNKRYIGITSQEPKRRWRGGSSYKNNIHFYNAIEKYGWDNFKHIIVAKGLNKETACWLEMELIKEWDTTNPNKGYNITLGGEGAKGLCGELNGMYGLKGELSPNYGLKRSEETKEKLSKALKGREFTEEWKQNLKENHWDCSGENNPMYGKGYLKEGENHPFFGKHHTEETKKRMSENHADFSRGNHPQAKKIICLETMKIFECIRDVSEQMNCNYGGLANAIRKHKKYKGYTFVYYKDYLKTLE